jgi:hypothetical protein
MDLQDIKKEIESLKKDTLSTSSKSDIYLFGFTKIKLALVFLVSALLVFAIKPVYIYDFSTSEKNQVERKINFKRLFFIYCLSFATIFAFFKYTEIKL